MQQMQLFAGLDVHQDSITATIKDDAGNPVRVQKVETNEDGVRYLFRRMKNIKAVFEASRSWTYYAALLRPYCKELIMAHPLKVRAIASARIKNDKIDSNVLCDLLMGGLIPQSYMPPQKIIELRDVLRYRVSLGRLRGKIKNKVHNILAREGKKCDFKSPFGPRARLWINHLELKPNNRRELEYNLGLIDNLSNEIAKLDKDIENLKLLYPEVDLLTSILGVGVYSGLLILAEIGDISRFPTPQKLAAYSGLISSTYQSGENCYQGRITKQGSKWLRWILVECAFTSIKKRHRIQKFYLRIKHKRGTQKAIVATARKMLTIIWHLLNKNQYYVP